MGLLSKLFGGGSSKSGAAGVLEETLQTVIEKAGLDLSFDVKQANDGKDILLDVFGQDEEALKDKDGALLDAMQLFLKRVLQNKVSEERINLIVDSGTFREDADQELIELAEKLKGIALKKKKPVYFRALPPRERKIVHQHLAEDKEIKSKSVGEGLFKKIKVFPANMKPRKSGGGGSNRGNSKPHHSKNNSSGGSNHGNSNHKEPVVEVDGNNHSVKPNGEKEVPVN